MKSSEQVQPWQPMNTTFPCDGTFCFEFPEGINGPRRRERALMGRRNKTARLISAGRISSKDAVQQSAAGSDDRLAERGR